MLNKYRLFYGKFDTEQSLLLVRGFFLLLTLLCRVALQIWRRSKVYQRMPRITKLLVDFPVSKIISNLETK